MRKLLLLTVVTMSMVSFAQTQKTPPVQEFIFEGDLIKGDLSKPDVEYFTPGSHALHPSLIKVRQDFNEKVMESAREL